MNYAKFEKLILKTHPTLNEKWFQERIAEEPGIIGLGDLILKDKERIQPRAGRLDLLLHHMPLGFVDEDEEIAETTDRTYWEERCSKKTVAMADQLLEIAKIHDQNLDLKYNKFYIGLAKNGQPSNFVIFKPKKGFIRFEPRLPDTPEMQDQLDSAGLDVMDYDKRWGRYRIRLQTNDIEKNKKTLEDVISQAYTNASKE